MQGHTATSRSDELRSYRTANAPMIAGQQRGAEGLEEEFVLYREMARRSTAPAAALTAISATGARFDAEDHRQRNRARGGGEREQPG